MPSSSSSAMVCSRSPSNQYSPSDTMRSGSAASSASFDGTLELRTGTAATASACASEGGDSSVFA